MIKLLPPRAYSSIKPLCGSTRLPIRCIDPCLDSPCASRKRDCAHCRAVCTFPTPVTRHQIPEAHSWYYDLTPDHSLSEDPETLLVWLCADCAAGLAGDVQFAGTDALHDGPCWQCGDPIETMERTTT
jgi:hypothetical protein